MNVCSLIYAAASLMAVLSLAVCNFGKLNYFLGKRAADEGRESKYPGIDFCRDPEAICSSKEHQELKWIGETCLLKRPLDASY